MVVACRDGGDYIGMNIYFTAMEWDVIENGKEYVDNIRVAFADFITSYAGIEGKDFNGEYKFEPLSMASEDESGLSDDADSFVFEVSDKKAAKEGKPSITYSGVWINGVWVEPPRLGHLSGDSDLRREAKKLLDVIDRNLREMYGYE